MQVVQCKSALCNSAGHKPLLCFQKLGNAHEALHDIVCSALCRLKFCQLEFMEGYQDCLVWVLWRCTVGAARCFESRYLKHPILAAPLCITCKRNASLATDHDTLAYAGSLPSGWQVASDITSTPMCSHDDI